MTSNYAWMQKALDWVAPVASQTNVVYVYPKKVLAFSGQTIAEYDAPFEIAKEPFGLQFQSAKTINWSKVTGVAVTHNSCNVTVSGGVVKLPKLEHFFDPEPIDLDGISYPARDIVAAVRSVIGAVSRDAVGWANCIHFEKDSVVAMPEGMTMMHHAILPYELERPAELSLDGARMLIGIPLDESAEAVFGGEIDIERADGSVYGTSYRALSVSSGQGRFMTVLSRSTPGSVDAMASNLHSGVKFHMEIDAELVDVFRVLKSLGDKFVYADMDFRADGLFVSGVGVDAVQVPVQYANNESPMAQIRLQIALVDFERKGMTRCGFIAPNKPFALFLDDKTIFVMIMEKRK